MGYQSVWWKLFTELLHIMHLNHSYESYQKKSHCYQYYAITVMACGRKRSLLLNMQYNIADFFFLYMVFFIATQVIFCLYNYYSEIIYYTNMLLISAPCFINVFLLFHLLHHIWWNIHNKSISLSNLDAQCKAPYLLAMIQNIILFNSWKCTVTQVLLLVSTTQSVDVLQLTTFFLFLLLHFIIIICIIIKTFQLSTKAVYFYSCPLRIFILCIKGTTLPWETWILTHVCFFFSFLDFISFI